MTTRQAIKASLVALSLTATLGSWAILAQGENRPTPTSPQVLVQPLDLPPIPTIVRPPADSAPGIASVQVNPALDLSPIPTVSASVSSLRPIARTRSSR